MSLTEQEKAIIFGVLLGVIVGQAFRVVLPAVIMRKVKVVPSNAAKS